MDFRRGRNRLEQRGLDDVAIQNYCMVLFKGDAQSGPARIERCHHASVVLGLDLALAHAISQVRDLLWQMDVRQRRGGSAELGVCTGVEIRQHLVRSERQVRHANFRRTRHGVADRGQRRDDGRLPDPADTIWVAGVRHFDNLRIDHG